MSATSVERRETIRSVGTWIGLVVAGVLAAGVVAVVDWFVLWGQSSTCYEAPDPDQVLTGRIWLGAVLLVSALPWLLGARMSRNRTPVVVVGLSAVLPGLLFFLDGLRTAAWVGGFCF